MGLDIYLVGYGREGKGGNKEKEAKRERETERGRGENERSHGSSYLLGERRKRRTQTGSLRKMACLIGGWGREWFQSSCSGRHLET